MPLGLGDETVPDPLQPRILRVQRIKLRQQQARRSGYSILVPSTKTSRETTPPLFTAYLGGPSPRSSLFRAVLGNGHVCLVKQEGHTSPAIHLLGSYSNGKITNRQIGLWTVSTDRFFYLRHREASFHGICILVPRCERQATQSSVSSRFKTCDTDPRPAAFVSPLDEAQTP